MSGFSFGGGSGVNVGQFGGGGATGKAKAKRNPFEQTPDPLADVEYPGDLEGDLKADLDATQIAFRERAAREQQRLATAMDSEFWFAACFKDRASKDAFLRAVGTIADGDKYVDGHKLAKALGVDLPTSPGA